MRTFVKIILLLFLIFGIGFCLNLIYTHPLSTKENTLVSILLTVISIVASWFLSHLYSESQYSQTLKQVKEEQEQNLKLYALKAAEKVKNLSEQLNHLSLFLEKELTNSEVVSVEEALTSRENKIESAVFMINTLKSVNDTSLSDWKGVIRDELDKQREEEKEKQDKMKEIISNYELLLEKHEDNLHLQEKTGEITEEIESIRKDLNLLLSNLTGTPIGLSKLSKKVRKQVDSFCPVCRAPLSYKQKIRKGGLKAFDCISCNEKLISRCIDEDTFKLDLRKPIIEKFICPNCSNEMQDGVDPLPTSAIITKCKNCGEELKIVRTTKGIAVKLMRSPNVSCPRDHVPIDEGIIEKIKNELPSQPWPVGIHKVVGDKLNLSPKLVQQVIQILIKRQVFNHQIDGQIYVPLKQNK